MTDTDKNAQRRSWVRDEMMLLHPNLTEEEADRLVQSAIEGRPAEQFGFQAPDFDLNDLPSDTEPR